jgi:hypothetical protein
MIGKCLCNHAGQDALHGPGRRVLNHVPHKDKADEFRCTVCGNITFGAAKTKDDKEKK